MAEELNNIQEEATEEVTAVEEVAATEPEALTKTDKKAKPSKKVSFGEKLKKVWEKVKKFFRDTVNEMKKVHWTPKAELKKSTILVVVAVLVVAAGLALVDSFFAFVISTLKGWIRV